MKKEFTGKGEIELSNEGDGDFPTDLSVPGITCQEAKDMWGLFREENSVHGEGLIFLLGHLADKLGHHQQGCPTLSENALEDVKKVYWKDV